MGFFKNSIATKFSLLIIALVVVTVFFTGLVFLRQRQVHNTRVEHETVLTDLKVVALKLSSGINSLPNAVSALAKSPSLHTYFEHQKEQDEDDNAIKARTRFLGEFVRSWNFIGSLCLHRFSDQTFVCFDSHGKQNETSAPYLDDVSMLFSEQHKFSRPSVKRIAGKLVQPLTSVMYYRQAVETVSGPQSIGEIYVEFLLENNIQQALLELKHSSQLLIFDQKGEYLYHPSGLRNWGLTLGSGYNAYKDYPQFEGESFGTSSSMVSDYILDIKIDDLNDTQAYGVAKVILDRDSNLYLNLAIIKTVAEKIRTNDLINTAGFFSLGIIVIFGTLIGWFFSRYLTRYLEEITDTARRFAKGETDVLVEVKTNDEIGVLATAFQGMVRQVNERTRILRKNEREIREARDQAEEALKAKSDLFEDLKRQKNEIEKISKYKDDLLAIVSHDLKNPLAVIETSLDVLIEDHDSKLSSMAQDLIRRSKNSAKFALNLITDLLDLARLEGGIKLDFEKININEMMRSVLDGLELKAREKKIQISISEDKSYEIFGDYGRIIQVIQNIVGNSLKFTPEGGKIDISISSEDQGEGKERNLVIKVKDNGPGIPRDKIDKIFNKFEQARTSDRAIGTGLGLAICKNIVQMHNGQISVDSVEGEGATFTIVLPRVIGEAKVGVKKKEVSKLMLLTKAGPLIDKIAHQLEQSSFQVESISNVREAIEKLSQSKVEFDALLVQYDMQNEDGMSIEWISQQESLQRIPVIALSDKVAPEIIDSIRGLAGDFFGLNFPFEELKSKVLRLLNRGDEIFQRKLNPKWKTIMVVEDEEGIREIVAEKIQSLDINAIKAKNGVEALFLMKKYPVDVVISDIRMPELDGLSLSRIINKSFPDVDIILMSSTAVEFPEELMKRLGVKTLLAKPFDIDSLDQLFDEYRSNANNIETVELQDAHVKATDLNGPTILLVDDSEDMHMLFDVLLKNEGVHIVHCYDGHEGLSKFLERSYDSIFMDVNMPNMDGVTAVKEMRKYEGENQKGHSKIVVISANNSKDDIDNYIQAGFDFAVSKPVSKQKILDALQRKLSESR
ncbi:MAG: hypothetical protein OHK0056_20550 [Bacteriovoracaceae bacterium]